MDIINSQLEVTGITLSPGISMAPICHFQEAISEQTSIYKISEKSVASELNRLKKSIEISKEEIKSISKDVRKQVGEYEAKIFETHIFVLEDEELMKKIYFKISNDLQNAEYAVKSVFEEYEALFEKMDDEYFKDRGTDFAELKRRILSHLTGEKGHFLCGEHCNTKKSSYKKIVITRELTPSMIPLIKKRNIVGFITKHGGKTSHAAILSRAAGIPYITDIDLTDNVNCGTIAIIDGDNSRVLFNPQPSIIEVYTNKIKTKHNLILKSPRFKGPVIKTRSNELIEIYANIISENEVNYIHTNCLAGIGLLRTEFLFFEYNHFPDIDEQTKVYKNIVKAAKGKPVNIRLFDLGGDKKIKSLDFMHEENPLLGLRGIRFLMNNKTILATQVNAICRAADHGKLRILYPMISSLQELKQVNSYVKNILSKNNKDKEILTGMMFEVPSVLIEPEMFLSEIDFGNLGTNDLLQYLFAVDRNNAYVSYLDIENENTLYKLISNLLKEAMRQKKQIIYCGELSFSSDLLKKLIKTGLRKISISPLGFQNTLNELSLLNTN